MSLRRALGVLLVLGALGSAGWTLSGATFSASSTNPRQAFTAASDWVAPTVTASVPSGTLRGTVTLSATAIDGRSGVASVRLQRAPAGGSTWTDVCTDTSAPYSCAFDTTAVADGRYDFRAIAVDVAGNAATSAVVANRLVDNAGPTVSLADPGADVRGTVTLSATASDAGAGVTSVRLQRSLADADTWTDVCTDTTTPYSCALDTTVLADNVYDLRAIATDGAGNTTTSAIQTVQVDNTAPTVTLADPGTPLSGTVSLTATAADADAGVATVSIQRAPAGSSTWTDVCVVSAEPWTCRWATTGAADGLYDLRAIAVDGAGNTKISATVASRRVDNTVSSVSLEDPGSPLRGTVTLTANANSTGGVASVLIQRSPAGKATWTDVCTDITAPYTCALDTTTSATPDGLYDFRAIMTTTAGAKLTSATVANRAIDNAPVRGTDVQATNVAGGTLGRMGTGDTIALTYSTTMRPSTLIAGWTGTGTAALYVRLTDANQIETTRFTRDAAGAQATGLGSLTTGGNFARTGRTIVFNATASLTTNAAGGSVVTITLGSVASGAGSLRTQNAATTLRWTPSAAATDTAGIATSTAVVTETGTADRDF